MPSIIDVSSHQPSRILINLRPKSLIILALIAMVFVLLFAWYLFAVIRGPQKPLVNNTDTPYGFTVLTIFDQTTIDDLKELRVNWVRYQLNWSDIETKPGKYDWRKLDSAVALANANGIHLTFPLQLAPTWALHQTCANRHILPDAQAMATFASAVAHRYNNHSKHGYIESYEVGNEEFDSLWTGDWNESTSCRRPDFVGPVLKATYLAIKAASPNARVGMNSMWWVSTTHVHDYMSWLYQNHYGPYFDFANFHYYICNESPDVTIGDRPSFDLEWQTIHNVMTEYGDGNKPIWVTEVGWNTSSVYQSARCIVTPQQQAQYIVSTAQSAMTSHAIQHIFWYTINRERDGMSITQPGEKLPSFYALKKFIQQHPIWSRQNA